METIPVEIAQEFLRHVSDPDTLLSLSCVSREWRLLVLPRLFAWVQVNPAFDHSIYQMATSPGCDLAKYVKHMIVTTSPYPVRMGPKAKFLGFIRCLIGLESVEFYANFDRLRFSVDDIETFARAFKTVHTVVVSSDTKSFPPPLILLFPELKALELRHASTTWTSSLANKMLSLKSSMEVDTVPVELRKLTLCGVSNLGVVTELFSKSWASYNRLQNLEVNYPESLHPDPVEARSSSAKVGEFLERFGGTIEELHLNVQRSTDLSGYSLAKRDLQCLNSLQVFKATLSAAKETHRIDSSPQDWLVPVIRHLPSPHMLKHFSFTFRIFLHNRTPLDNLTGQLCDFFHALDSLLYRLYTGLKQVSVQSREGIDLEADTFDYRPSTVL